MIRQWKTLQKENTEKLDKRGVMYGTGVVIWDSVLSGIYAL